MAISSRYRVNTSKNPSSLFKKNQSLGSYFDDTVEEIVDKKRSITLSAKDNQKIILKTMKDWKAFKKKYLKSDDKLKTDRECCELLKSTLGIPFANFVRFIESVNSAPKKEKKFVCERESDLANTLGLYGDEAIYGRPPESEEVAALTETEEDVQWGSPIHPNSKHMFTLPVSKAILPRIVLSSPDLFFGRDREEIEAHFDFNPTGKSWKKFKDGAVIDIWIPLDFENLPDEFWEDADRRRLFEMYSLPLHLEKDPEEDQGYEETRRKFLDVYLDTEDGILQSNDLSLRSRIRFERKRGLIQMKEEKGNNPQTRKPVREKWERRFNEGYLGDSQPSMDRMVSFCQYGFACGAPMSEIKKLLKKLMDKQAHDGESFLHLRADHLIAQDRYRTHLRLDSTDTLSERLDEMEKIASGLRYVPKALTFYINKTKQQLEFLQNCTPIMEKYGFSRMVEGEAIIISRDRWVVIEPGAYSQGEWPDNGSLMKHKGIRGRGLRAEVELDSWTSDPIEHVLKAINKRIEDGDGDLEELTREKLVIEKLQSMLLEDVHKTATLQKEHYIKLGLKVAETTFSSKSEAAQQFIAQGQGGFRRGHRYWI
ncbi:MAG: hypothetical protein AB2745_07755 [Candidatus Thiodiazotropha endolucinida]